MSGFQAYSGHYGRYANDKDAPIPAVRSLDKQFLIGISRMTMILRADAIAHSLP
jgi:hypothetical protein